MTVTERPGPKVPVGAGPAPPGVELRHLRYFVAVADAGTFTQAAERMFVAQPTLSQQIRRLEELVGAPLLQRGREGVRLTEAGAVLLEEARALLSLLDHGVRRTRHAAGLERPRLRFAVPAYLPEALAVAAASRLRSVAAAAGVQVTWLETALDAEFSPVQQRRADAGLGWLTVPDGVLPPALDVMSMGAFEPDVWLPRSRPGEGRAEISLDELARLDVIHGPRRASSGTYDAWLEIMRAVNPRFDFSDPPFRHSLPMMLAFAATASRPTAVLTGPRQRAGAWQEPAPPERVTGAAEMVAARVERGALTAAAALVWNSDLPRELQQVLFDTGDSAIS